MSDENIKKEQERPNLTAGAQELSMDELVNVTGGYTWADGHWKVTMGFSCDKFEEDPDHPGYVKYKTCGWCKHHHERGTLFGWCAVNVEK